MNIAARGTISSVVGRKRVRMPIEHVESERISGFLMRHGQTAYWAAFRVSKSAHLSEEAVQEAYVAFICRLPKYRGDEQMLHCFIKTVRNLARNLARTERRKSKRQENYAQYASATMRASEASAEGAELALAARSALNSLPMEEREAVGLCCEQGFTRESAAEILGIPKQTVTDRVNRGLEKLRKILAQQGYSVATPLAVGTALSSLPLPAVPAGLTAAMQNLAANPALAAAKAAKLSAKALSQTAAKKTAVGWLATGLAATGAAVAFGLWLWNDVQQNVVVSRAETTERNAKQESEPNFVTVYDDRFDGAQLADFWETVEPTAQVTVNSLKHPASLFIEAAGAEANRIKRWNLRANVQLTSRAIEPQDKVLVIFLRSNAPTTFSGIPGRKERSGWFTVVNADGKTLAVRAANEDSKSLFENQGAPQAVEEGGPSAIFRETIRAGEIVNLCCLWPSGKVFFLQDALGYWGQLVQPPNAVKIRLGLTVKENSFSSWEIKRIAVRRLNYVLEETEKSMEALLKGLLAEQAPKIGKPVVK